MNFWYVIIRDRFGKIRAKRSSVLITPTQADALASMKFDFAAGDVVVELDCGDHMDQGQFSSYVELMYQNKSDIKVILTEIEHLVGK